ncbi:transglutaminase-like domain-containing protein [Corallococcus sp. M34]|uniref:transglutaminase-like domain-containing protein n=1 Tax=Citreicoccus inhibens TaxID=2849499 RepID=UPI001C21F3A2|nr:transglutaminase-like domain-containing protein [Citreicoccus inhibens]MBU8900366.1 transglutaminase-like domain-containing protein [Citreicoccus inhibens]
MSQKVQTRFRYSRADTLLTVVLFFLLPFRSVAAEEPPMVRTVKELLALPEDRLNIGDAALLLGALMDPDTDVTEGRRRIELLSGQVRSLVGGRTDPDYRIRAVNQILYRESRFAYDKDDPLGARLDASSLWRLLSTKKGNCVSLPVLWYAVAERLGYPVAMVEAPHHFFLRYQEGQYQSNIEATSGGGEASDEKIILDLEISQEAVSSGAMMRSLSKRELLGALIAEVAARLMNDWNIGLAARLSEQALTAHPRSMAANWNLAMVYNYEAAIGSSVRTPGEKAASHKNPRVMEAARRALNYAQAATRLGAPGPLAPDYWKKVSTLGGTEMAAKKPSPRPFNVSTLFAPGGKPIQFALAVDPGIFERASRHPGNVLRVCSALCGPAPGNRCADFKPLDLGDPE